MTLDVWAIGAQRKAPADRVLKLAVCPADDDVGEWTPDDWRWLIGGAFKAHRGETKLLA